MRVLPLPLRRLLCGELLDGAKARAEEQGGRGGGGHGGGED